MEIRHNTKLLEQAVNLVVQRAGISVRSAEALAAEKLARAAAVRWLSFGAAVAMAAVGIGLGVMFASRSNMVAKQAIDTPVVDQQSPEAIATTTSTRTPSRNDLAPVTHPARKADRDVPPVTSSAPAPAPTETHGPLFNYVKFGTASQYAKGHLWHLQAGHQFASDADIDWRPGWCYAETVAGGVQVYIELADRADPASKPIGPISNAATLQQIGFTDADAIDLATHCPWLDRREFSASDFGSQPNREPANGLNQLTMPTPAPVMAPTESPTPVLDVSMHQYAGYDLVGHDEGGFIANVDAASCQQKCQDDSECDGYVHNKSSGGACFLKTFKTSGILKFKSAAILATTTTGIKAYAEALAYNIDYNIKYNQSIEGTNILSESTSIENCAKMCDLNQYCRAFTYNNNKSYCSLINNPDSWVLGFPGTISGLKN